MLGWDAKTLGRTRILVAVVIGLVALALAAGALSADDGVLEIEIQISPHVLNVAAYGEEVTVHTDIAYTSVDASTVTLSGVELSGSKADDCGNFVAKLEMRDLLGLDLVIGERYEFVLEGLTDEGDPFAGAEAILIVSNRGAQGRAK